MLEDLKEKQVMSGLLTFYVKKLKFCLQANL